MNWKVQINSEFLYYYLFLAAYRVEMETEENGQVALIRQVVTSNNHTMQLSFLDFLGIQILMYLYDIATTLQNSSYFLRLVLLRIHTHKYANRVDRTMFFLFYQDQQFRSIEEQHLLMMAQEPCGDLTPLFEGINSVTKQLQGELEAFELEDELIETIQACYFEPELPLPKLKRETIGVYCETPLQQFVSLLKFPDQEFQQWLDPPLEKLKEELELTNISSDQVLDFNQEDIDKMLTLRFNASAISADNLKAYLIHSFPLHNILACLFAMAELLNRQSLLLINSHHDPLLKFAEFSLRSNVFRSMVLAVEEKMGFLFTMYNEIVAEALPKLSAGPKFGFWLHGMTIWAKGKDVVHLELSKTFSYFMARQRQENLHVQLQEMMKKLPSTYLPLKNQLELNTYNCGKKEQCFQGNMVQNSVEAFFENSPDLYQIIAKDYLEYMVDISINEFTVHWCGHSMHLISASKQLRNFMDTAVHENMDFYRYLHQTIKMKLPEELQLSTLKEIIKQDLKYIDGKFAKPLMLRKTVDKFNEQVRDSLAEETKYQVFEEEGVEQAAIRLDFAQKDNLLDYFANKAEIAGNCPENLQKLYSIGEETSFESMVAMAHRKDSDDESDLNESHECYSSESDS